jgi:hypothetical protein
VMASDVCHDLGAGEDLDVELILDLLQLLGRVSGSLLEVVWRWFNIPPGGSPSPCWWLWDDRRLRNGIVEWGNAGAPQRAA